MRFIFTTDYHVERFKQAAKKLRRSNTISHRDALDKVAKANGYNHWHHVTLCHQETQAKFPEGIKAGAVGDPATYVQREVERVLERAEQGDARLVRIGSLAFFSTEDGDAWMLDPPEGLALCLRWRGERQDFSIEESPERFHIYWDAEFAVANGAFTVASRNPKIGRRTIYGYPGEEIEHLFGEATV